MTLPTWLKKELRKMFASCFTYDAPQYQMAAMCMMQCIKGGLPTWVTTLRTLRTHLYNQFNARFEAFPSLQVFVACFDRKTPEPKSMVCHETRYERRCKLCKKKPTVPYGKVAGPECFDPACEKGCIDNQILWFDPDNLHINVDELDAPLPDWNRYSSDNRNLRQVLYPLMMNWMLSYIPPAGKTVLISGLPCSKRTVKEYISPDYNAPGAHQKRGETHIREILTPWLLGNLPIPADTDYSSVFMIRGIPPCQQYPTGHLLQQEVPEMRNEIHEADNAIFFFSKFFPDLYVHMGCINDGDGISIGLLRAYEDFRGGPQPLQEQWLALPVRSTGETTEDRVEYINLTLMVQKVESYPEFIKNGIQSPIATLIFMIILGGTDFFDGEFCFGIGPKTDWNEDDTKRANQTKGIWDTFRDRLDMFHHLVQYYVNVRDYTGDRRIVIDEDLFAIFTKMCYTNKYEKAAKGKSVQVHCASFKDPRKHFPTDEVIQRWARQVAWNLNYWALAWRNLYPDPFECYMDQSYWGYTKDRGIVNVVASKQKPLDEVHKRHLWKRTQKQLESVNIPEIRKKNAMDAVRGVY